MPFSARSEGAVDITDPVAGSEYGLARTAFEQGRFDGVGLILNGDGLVGVDLDSCVVDGQPTLEALAVLRQLNAHYVELSPSGTGLRAFGFAQARDSARGEYGGTRLELYAKSRYLTVTGNLLHNWSPQGIPSSMPEYGTVLARIRSPLNAQQEKQAHQAKQEEQVTQESQDSHELQARVEGNPPKEECKTSDFPEACLPSGEGKRHAALFVLARHLRAEMPNASEDELYVQLERWHALVKDRIVTKDLALSWSEFLVAWHRVRVPLGQAVLTELAARSTELPGWMRGHKFGPLGDKLLRLCVQLALYHHPEPFFLSGGVAGAHIERHHTQALNLLRAMVVSGYLERVDTGYSGRASTYRIGTAAKDGARREDQEATGSSGHSLSSMN